MLQVKNVAHDGNITLGDVIAIARIMRPRSMARELKGTVREILGTCQSVGCTIDGDDAQEMLRKVEEDEARLRFSPSARRVVADACCSCAGGDPGEVEWEVASQTRACRPTWRRRVCPLVCGQIWTLLAFLERSSCTMPARCVAGCECHRWRMEGLSCPSGCWSVVKRHHCARSKPCTPISAR